MSLPRFMLQHRLRAEPARGQDAHVEGWGDPVELACWWDGWSDVAGDGAAHVRAAKVLLDLDALEHVPLGSRITDPWGRTGRVHKITPRDSGGLLPLEHLEIEVR